MIGRARVAGVFYLLNFVIGSLALVFARRGLPAYGDAAVLVAAGCYVVVTALFYEIFKSVDRTLSSIAAAVSLTGCIVSVLAALHVTAAALNPLALFGVYCLLIGYLVFASRFLPRTLGVLLMIGGISWTTFAAPALARLLAPYNFAPGILAEGALTVWLLVFGVNNQRGDSRMRAMPL